MMQPNQRLQPTARAGILDAPPLMPSVRLKYENN
jgi:hypothetical protein